jgi:hypothetical protein
MRCNLAGIGDDAIDYAADLGPRPATVRRARRAPPDSRVRGIVRLHGCSALILPSASVFSVPFANIWAFSRICNLPAGVFPPRRSQAMDLNRRDAVKFGR